MHAIKLAILSLSIVITLATPALATSYTFINGKLIANYPNAPLLSAKPEISTSNPNPNLSPRGIAKPVISTRPTNSINPKKNFPTTTKFTFGEALATCTPIQAKLKITSPFTKIKTVTTTNIYPQGKYCYTRAISYQQLPGFVKQTTSSKCAIPLEAQSDLIYQAKIADKTNHKIRSGNFSFSFNSSKLTLAQKREISFDKYCQNYIDGKLQPKMSPSGFSISWTPPGGKKIDLTTNKELRNSHTFIPVPTKTRILPATLPLKFYSTPPSYNAPTYSKSKPNPKIHQPRALPRSESEYPLTAQASNFINSVSTCTPSSHSIKFNLPFIPKLSINLKVAPKYSSCVFTFDSISPSSSKKKWRSNFSLNKCIFPRKKPVLSQASKSIQKIVYILSSPTQAMAKYRAKSLITPLESALAPIKKYCK